MPKKDYLELPSKGAWRAMKEIKERELSHLKVTTGIDTTILDSPVALDLRLIPKVFTAPFQAVGLVTSIFANMLNSKIALEMKEKDD